MTGELFSTAALRAAFTAEVGSVTKGRRGRHAHEHSSRCPYEPGCGLPYGIPATDDTPLTSPIVDPRCPPDRFYVLHPKQDPVMEAWLNELPLIDLRWVSRCENCGAPVSTRRSVIYQTCRSKPVPGVHRGINRALHFPALYLEGDVTPT